MGILSFSVSPWGPAEARGCPWGPYYGAFLWGPFDLVGIIGELNNLTDMNMAQSGPLQISSPKFFPVPAGPFLAKKSAVLSGDYILLGVAVGPRRD